jgi:hypothetical protein
MRQIPLDIQASSSSLQSTSPQRDERGNARTINPSLLENHGRGSKFTFEAPSGKKMPSLVLLIPET